MEKTIDIKMLTRMESSGINDTTFFAAQTNVMHAARVHIRDNPSHFMTYSGNDPYNLVRACVFGIEFLGFIGGDITDGSDRIFSEFISLDNNRPKILTSAHFLRASVPENITVYQVPFSIYKDLFLKNKLPQTIIKKNFSVLMSRLDIFRLNTFYNLFNDGLLDSGYVSFNCLNAFDRHIDRVDYTTLQQHNTNFFNTDNFEAAVVASSEIIPYKNFTEPDPEFYMIQNGRLDNGEYNTVKIIDIWMSAKCFMVHETYPQSEEQTSIYFFSEKTVCALQTARPFVLFAGQDSLATLRNHGFKVFDDYVDHESYDHESSTVSRHDLAYNEFKRLHQALAPTESDIQKWHEYAEHNRQLLFSTSGFNKTAQRHEEQTLKFLELLKVTDPSTRETIINACKQQQDML